MPRWFRLQDAEENLAYFKRVQAVSVEKLGRMVFRPSATAPIGVIAIGDVVGADTRRWIARQTPWSWVNAADLQSWALSRGFTSVSSVAKLSQRVWAFRAEIGGQQQSFSFASGITVTLAVGSASPKKEPNKEGAEQRAFKPQWGAPAPKQGKPAAAPEPEPQADVEMQNAEEPPEPPVEVGGLTLAVGVFGASASASAAAARPAGRLRSAVLTPRLSVTFGMRSTTMAREIVDTSLWRAASMLCQILVAKRRKQILPRWGPCRPRYACLPVPCSLST